MRRVGGSGLAGISTIPSTFVEAPFVTVVAEDDITVGVAQVVICSGSGSASKRRLVQVVNLSTAGQLIRVGAAPSIGGNAGSPLFPGQGDVFIIGNMATGLNAIASAAAGTLSRMVMDSA